jgi:hypothetical protein
MTERFAMKRAVFIGLVALCALGRPATAFAGIDFIDWLEQFSGPGPFHSYFRSIGARVICTYDDAGTHRIGTCLSDLDPKIKTVLTAEYAWASSHDNSRFETVDPNNRASINTSRILVNYYYRVSPMLDVGVGAGALIFTGDGFDNQTHPVLTPIALTFTPLGFLHGETSAKWGRVVRVKFDERYVLGDINSVDFRSPAGYLKHGEMNRGVSVDIDFWTLLSRRR